MGFDPSFDKLSGYKTISMLVMPVFAANDEEILSVLVRFVGPLIKGSSLFTVKKKKIEAQYMTDLNKHKINRQPSTQIDLENVVIEEEEEEQDDFKDDL